jgi:GAF domain-containing protein
MLHPTFSATVGEAAVPDDVGDSEALRRAEETVARQEEVIAELREQLADERFAGDLRAALSVAGIAGTLGSPVSHARLLTMIMETAAKVMDAESALLLLLDREGDELVFDVTLGVDADEVKGLKMPLGHGIAGLVAASGQPMAISDPAGDPRVAPEIVEALSYVPRSILCVPLSYNDRIIGTLEVLDKDGGGSFDTRDIEILGLFAKQAAVAIMQSRTSQSIGALLGEVLDTTGGDRDPAAARAQATSFATGVEKNAAYGHARELTELLVELSAYGEDEVAACLALVRDFADYVRARPWPGTSDGAGP